MNIFNRKKGMGYKETELEILVHRVRVDLNAFKDLPG